MIERPFHITVAASELGPPGPGMVLVTTRRVGICGSDLHALAGKHPFVPLPCRPGHEAVGEVRTLGDGVAGLAPGERVVVEPNLVCGRCLYCQSGRYNLCESLRVFGCQTTGAMAEAFIVPADRLLRVPDDLSDAQAALIEPTATATYALRLAEGVAGRTVAVLGAGTVGLLMLLVARAGEARTVAMTDGIASKRQRALRLGADLVVDPAEPDAVSRIRDAFGRRADVTFDCVAVQSTIDQAIGLAQKGGTVVVVGVPTGPVLVPLPIVQDHEIRIQGSLMYVRKDVLRAVDLVRQGTIPVGEIVTATYPLDRAADAFDAARSGEQVKVHVVVSGSG